MSLLILMNLTAVHHWEYFQLRPWLPSGQLLRGFDQPDAFPQGQQQVSQCQHLQVDFRAIWDHDVNKQNDGIFCQPLTIFLSVKQIFEPYCTTPGKNCTYRSISRLGLLLTISTTLCTPVSVRLFKFKFTICNWRYIKSYEPKYELHLKMPRHEFFKN